MEAMERMQRGEERMTDRTSSPGPKRRFPANAKGFLLAPVLWFVWFVALYSIQGWGCAIGLDRAEFLGTSVLRVALGALTLAAAIAIGIVGARSLGTWTELRGRGEDTGGRPVDESIFLSYGAALHSALFLIAVSWIGIPILMTDLCGG